MSTSDKLFREAQEFLPGGVNSPVRAWKAVGGNPLFIQRAKGSCVVDADGREYLDYVGSWGPLIAGHAHPQVVSALENAVRRGTSYGAPTAKEIELARMIVEAFPSVEKVRLVNSGTEATMTAVRLARAHTGRAKIIKFSGCYHGHTDALLIRAGSGGMTFGVPDSAGVPEAYASLTLIAEFNDTSSVETYLQAEGNNIAAIIVEPVPGNMGVVPPGPGFLPALREETRRRGIVLIFDEVISGFRLARGGAQEVYGVEADLTCLGKVIGGGLPVGAVGGKREIMELLAPQGPVYQAGTLAGNPLATTAGVETLKLLRSPGAYDRLNHLGEMMASGLRQVLHHTGVRACVNQVGSMFTLFFGVDEVTGYATSRPSDTQLFARYFRGMLDRGIYLPPSQFEAAFLSLAHTEADVEKTLSSAKEVLQGMQS
jgi:glutamate-1-semialdehyde 2,1-aminomutase